MRIYVDGLHTDELVVPVECPQLGPQRQRIWVVNNSHRCNRCGRPEPEYHPYSGTCVRSFYVIGGVSYFSCRFRKPTPEEIEILPIGVQDDETFITTGH